MPKGGRDSILVWEDQLDMTSVQQFNPGPIVLFGSGETSPSGRKIFERVFRKLPESPRIALLETPAGFELNSAQVIGRVADFLRHRLQNFNPQVMVIPARKRNTPFSPDDPEIVEPLYLADAIFMGPGSPTYAVRQLHDSLAWNIMIARHRLGATIILASAATIAISRRSLPVYEIYKVGDDIHWKAGLDLFGTYGLPLVFIPHWNNNDGGDELDTSRCFMGQPRFAELMKMLPPDLTVLGIDEKTALIMDPPAGNCHVIGLGGVTLLHTGHQHDPPMVKSDLEGTGLGEVAEQRNGHVHQYMNGESFPLSECCPFDNHKPVAGLPPEVWQRAVAVQREAEQHNISLYEPERIPSNVQALLDERQAARARRDWMAADNLRDQIAALGWQVLDTPQGPRIERLP